MIWRITVASLFVGAVVSVPQGADATSATSGSYELRLNPASMGWDLGSGNNPRLRLLFHIYTHENGELRGNLPEDMFLENDDAAAVLVQGIADPRIRLTSSFIGG